MKPIQVLGGLAVLVSATSSGFAATTTFEWAFGSSANPSSVTPPPAQNPFGGTGTATINQQQGTGYWPGVFLDDPSQGYGSRTGLWDIGGNGSGVALGVSLQPATANESMTYQVTLDEFVSTPGGFPPYSPNVTFSFAGTSAQPTLVDTTLEQTSNGGTWIERVYTLNQVTLTLGGPLTLTIDPTDSGSGLLLDRVQWDVTGDLMAVPEPTALQLGAVGAAFVGLLSWYRSRARA